MKSLLIATGVAALLMGSGFAASPAQASWAENAQGNPVYTGTNQSYWHSEWGRRNFSNRAGRGWDMSPGYGAAGYDTPGYGAYGRYNGYYR
jgi:opacity protein-like surface antigen